MYVYKLGTRKKMASTSSNIFHHFPVFLQNGAISCKIWGKSHPLLPRNTDWWVQVLGSEGRRCSKLSGFTNGASTPQAP